jgi:hypothetical protein
MRGDFAFGKFADRAAKLLLLVGQGKFHETSQEKARLLGSLSFIP